VSLEGTLETIALPDVLALLSVTGKTGELRVEAGGRVGSVWFDAGKVAGYEVGTTNTPVDALFALLRLQEGSFKFYTGTQAINPIGPADVAPMLEEAEGRLMQWPAIASTVPSLLSGLNLYEAVDDTIMLRPDQWKLVVSVGGGRPVGEVLDLRGLGEFEGCKAIKELVELHLVQISGDEAPLPPEASLSAAAVRHPVPEPPAANGYVVDNDQWQEPGAPAGAGEPPSLASLISTGYAPEEEPGAGYAPDAGGMAVAGQYAYAPEGAYAAGPEQVAFGPEGGPLPAEMGGREVPEVWREEPQAVEPHAGEPTAAEPEQPEEPVREPVNRGLLLKFLGSARN
jgi:Domain of unknown function (DUF4388)